MIIIMTIPMIIIITPIIIIIITPMITIVKAPAHGGVGAESVDKTKAASHREVVEVLVVDLGDDHDHDYDDDCDNHSVDDYGAHE